MEEALRLDTVRQYNDYLGVDTLHPLVSVVNFDEVPVVMQYRHYMGIYAIFLKNNSCGDIVYGCQTYDYEDGTLVFVSPGQVYGIHSHGKAVVPSGYALVFHPDFIKDTQLGKVIRNYSFFSYEVFEALHLSKKEKDTIVGILQKIAQEIDQNIDRHSKTLVAFNIELLLNYCMRFYDRQFLTRSHANKDILSKFPFTPPPMNWLDAKCFSTSVSMCSVIRVSASIVTRISPFANAAPAFLILDKFLSVFSNVTQL